MAENYGNAVSRWSKMLIRERKRHLTREAGFRRVHKAVTNGIEPTTVVTAMSIFAMDGEGGSRSKLRSLQGGEFPSIPPGNRLQHGLSNSNETPEIE